MKLTVAPSASSLLRLALFAYFLSMIVMITLLPFRFHWPTHVRIQRNVALFDMVTNISLFLPLGFCYRLLRKDQPDRCGLRTLGVGIVLSLGIEFVQLFLSGRYSSVADVVANSVGAWGGAMLYQQIRRRLHERLVGQLALELPLMHMFYLFVPLLWLNVLAAGNDETRLWLTPLLGFCGSSILAAIWRYRLQPAGVLSVSTLALAVMAWFLIGVMPGMARQPAFLLLCSAGVGLTVPLFVHASGQVGETERRFELLTLQRIGPLYVVYVILLLLWPWPWALQPWRGGLGFAEIADRPGFIATLRIVEDIAAFTLLGYMLTELRGRHEEPSHQTLQWLLICSVLGGGGLELLRGLHPYHVASLAHLIVMTSAVLYGGMVYRLQLATVQGLLTSDHLAPPS